MITQDQASLLVHEGVLSFQREPKGWEPHLASLLEFLVVARNLIEKSIDNGKHHAPWVNSTERYRHLIQAAGVLNLALQHHGSAELNLHHLRRALHPQQAERRSELLEEQFIRKECADMFRECFVAAQTGAPYNASTWERLKCCLERLGVQF